MTHTHSRGSVRRLGAVLGSLLAVWLVAACGSESAPSPELDRAVIVSPETPTDATAPTGTLPDDLGDPEIVDQAVAPMGVIGDALPYFSGGFGKPDDGIGEKAPVILGYDVEGEVHRIDATEQGKTMVIVAAHWCPHCAKELPLIIDMKAKGELPDELNLYAVVTASDPQAPNWPPTEWLRGLGWTDPIILDGLGMVEHDGETKLQGLISPAMGTEGVPTMVLIDEDGTMVARWSGEVPRDVMLNTIYSALYPELASPSSTGATATTTS